MHNKKGTGMKEKFKRFGFIILILGVLATLLFYCPMQIKNANATTSSPDITRSNYKEYDFDSTLFEAVLAMAKQLNCNQPLVGRGFDTNLFLKNASSTYVPSYVEDGVGTDGYEENIEARNQIVDDLKIGVLDFTTGQNAKYDCLKTISNPIKSITGLNSMSLSFIRKLYLNNNNIEEIASTDFTSLGNLEEIYAKNNSLTQFALNSNIDSVSVLDLSENKLSEIDVSNLVANANVDLSNNNIESTTQIKFSAEKKLGELNLEFNLLNNLSADEISALNLKVQTMLNLGFQGINNNVQDFTAGRLMKVYNLDSNYLQNISVKIFYFEGNEEVSASQFYLEGEDNIICSSSTSGNLYLPAGKIKMVFYTNNVEVDEDIYPNYSAKVLEIKTPKLKYSVIIDGKETTETYQEDNFDLSFYFEEDENIPNLNKILQEAKIYSSINNNLAERDLIKINENGTFKCTAYISFDGINSEEISVDVTRKYVKGILIGIVLIVLIFVLIGAGYFIARWYRGGASVAPLSDRELASLQRRRHKKEEEIRDVFIRGSGKERYFKVAEDEVLSDLNGEKVGAHYNSSQRDDYNADNYSGGYSGVGNNMEKYDQEEFKNDFEDSIDSNESNDDFDEENINLDDDILKD